MSPLAFGRRDDASFAGCLGTKAIYLMANDAGPLGPVELGPTELDADAVELGEEPDVGYPVVIYLTPGVVFVEEMEKTPCVAPVAESNRRSHVRARCEANGAITMVKRHETDRWDHMLYAVEVCCSAEEPRGKDASAVSSCPT